MKNIYLITHGIVFGGHNQDMMPDGLKQIASIRETLIPKLPWIPVFFVGLGARHKQTCDVLTHLYPHPRIRLSPFCGTADEITEDGKIDTKYKISKASDYLGLVNTVGFNPWNFVSNLPTGAIICAGRELMYALGLRDIYVDGQLYELDAETKTGKVFSGNSPT